MVTEKGLDYERKGWGYMEEIGEEDDAEMWAEEAFTKAIESGNPGGYYGLYSLQQDLDQETKEKYLRNAAMAGRVDAMWELYLELGDKHEGIAWLILAASKDVIADANDELEEGLNDLDSKETEAIKELSAKFLIQIQEAGFELGTGANFYL